MKIEIIRHSLAHILAYAVQELYPETKFGIGPSIENGFYYDFKFPKPITPEDLSLVEKTMKEIIKKGVGFKMKNLSAEEGKSLFKNQPYKLELIEELAENSSQPISAYESGEFTDLCRGPHVASTKEIKSNAFTLTKIAGAYWRGDERNQMLTRIYGVAFETKEELEQYLARLREAEKRDHRKLGKELELFMISEEVGKGLVIYLPNGAFIRKKLEDYMYEKEFKNGYSYVMTPVLAKESMYKKSGHLAHYREDMYNPIDIEGENYYLKPMNCPHHHIIYKNTQKSYRDLPLRIADFGMIHRYERSGVLTGIIRARNFSQNDAHIYCAKTQIKKEFINVLKLFDEVYKDFNIKNYWFRLSLPDYNDQKKYGDLENKEMWEYSADIARQAMREYGVTFEEVKGEAAFYGPKIDVETKNVLGKEDTIATMQIDFYMPERFDLTFINEKGKEERPVIIHRAIMGSFDRFFAFLIEQTAGAFPVWLSPIQARIIPISTEKHLDYAKKIHEELTVQGIRAKIDESNETLGKKIRAGEIMKIPYLMILGDKEMENKTGGVRERGKGDIGEMTIEAFLEKIKNEIKEKK